VVIAVTVTVYVCFELHLVRQPQMQKLGEW
jgi:hypothetical protein